MSLRTTFFFMGQEFHEKLSALSLNIANSKFTLAADRNVKEVTGETKMRKMSSIFLVYGTVNPLYNSIHYNVKICYNINPICTKISRLCIFFYRQSMLIFGKTNVLDIY